MPNDLYEVVEQRPSITMGIAGRSEPATVVMFRTKATGATGEVTVSDADFTPEHVDKVIREKVPTIDAVAQL